jgi:hypothetical protein
MGVKSLVAIDESLMPKADIEILTVKLNLFPKRPSFQLLKIHPVFNVCPDS